MNLDLKPNGLVQKSSQKTLQFRIVDLHKAGKGFNCISKSLNVHQSTVTSVNGESSALLPCGSPVKMSARAQHPKKKNQNPRASPKQQQNSSINTSSQLWRMLEGASWSGAALVNQGLDGLWSSTEKWILKFIKPFCRRPSVHQHSMADATGKRSKAQK